MLSGVTQLWKMLSKQNEKYMKSNSQTEASQFGKDFKMAD